MPTPDLGYTRSAYARNHLLQTPDTFIRAPLPGMERGVAIVHAGPALGARFTEYTVELEPDGTLGHGGRQRFIYVLSGSVTLFHNNGRQSLSAGEYCYGGPHAAYCVSASEACRLVVIEKPYSAIEGLNAPDVLIKSTDEISAQPVMGDPAVRVQALLPDDPSFDFAVNIMTFDPGASLSLVEMHVMEHGLLMLDGGGIYRLDENWYPVTAGDFIWMAPYCPQWFGALGKLPARYLLYKDWNRHPFAS
jgi:(S)-ureidoglycine aminohydrolase